MNIKDLTVVGVFVPKQAQKGDGIIKISPQIDYLEAFPGKEFYFAETKLTIPEFLSFFNNTSVSGNRVAEYVKTQNSNLIFKTQLFKGSGLECTDIFYDPIYKRSLNLENVLGNGDLSADRENYLRAQILYAQSFEQAQYLIDNAEFDAAKNKILYVNFIAGYSIHLLKGCNFIEDVSVPVDTEKIKQDLAFIYKAYQLHPLWESDQSPNIVGEWSPGKEFKLFSYKDKEDTNKVNGFISDEIGLQYFEGLIDDHKRMIIKSRYFVERRVVSLDWGKICCFGEKEITFPLEGKRGHFLNAKGNKIRFSFNKQL